MVEEDLVFSANELISDQNEQKSYKLEKVKFEIAE
mgnify:FL=1